MFGVFTLFPAVGAHNCAVTSPATPDYNCIAWAAGDESAWWEPDPLRLYFWPRTAPRMYTLGAYAEAFRTIGYESCSSRALEPGVEKVALFWMGDRRPHAARQLSDGLWTSKFGQDEDVHHELEAIEGDEYGFVKLVLRRPRP